MTQVYGASDVRAGLDDRATPLNDDDALSADLHPRHLAKRIGEITAVIIAVAVAVSALPGLGEVRHRLGHVDAIWIAALLLAEFCSCAGYVLVFRSTFCPHMSWGLSYDIAMAEQAANTLLPAGGAGGLALGVWALRRTRMAAGHIARRTVAFFVVTSAANFGTLAVVGVLTFAGALLGQTSVPLTLVPALATLLGAALATASPHLLRALDLRGRRDGGEGWQGRARQIVHEGLRAGAHGLDQAHRWCSWGVPERMAQRVGGGGVRDGEHELAAVPCHLRRSEFCPCRGPTRARRCSHCHGVCRVPQTHDSSFPRSVIASRPTVNGTSGDQACACWSRIAPVSCPGASTGLGQRLIPVESCRLRYCGDRCSSWGGPGCGVLGSALYAVDERFNPADWSRLERPARQRGKGRRRRA